MVSEPGPVPPMQRDDLRAPAERGGRGEKERER
jgi:hypothetical protein